MVNIGAVWGLGLAIIVCFIIYKKAKKRIEKEVKVINVTRPEEKRDAGSPTDSSGITTRKPIVKDRAGRKRSKGTPKKRWGISAKSSKAIESNDSRDKQHSTAIPPPEPFKY